MSSLVFLSSSPLSQKPTKHNLEVFNGWPRLSPFLVDFLQIAINSGQVVVSHQLQECHGLASGRSGFPTLFLMKITMIYYCHLPWYWYDNIISYVHGPWIKTSLNRQRFRRFFLTSNLESNCVSAMLGQWDPMGPIISARAESTNRRTPRSVAAATKYVKLHGMYRCRHWSLKMCKHV